MATLCLYTLSSYRPTLEDQSTTPNVGDNVSERYEFFLYICSICRIVEFTDVPNCQIKLFVVLAIMRE